MLPEEHSSRGHYLCVAIILGLVTFLSRVPYLQEAVIDWDESTFILMGQSIVDGHLPYTELWDNKPPLAFAFFALPILLFGKSIAAVRLAGMLCVTLTAFLVYVFGHRFGGRRAGLISAILSIFAIGVLPSGQAVMTEHIALAPLVGALVLAVVKRPTVGTMWWLGVLMGLATLVRLNLAYTAVIVGVMVLALPPRPQGREWLIRSAAYASGGMVVVLVTYIPYLISGQSDIWWTSVVSGPLAYSQSRFSLYDAIVHQIYNGMGIGHGFALSNYLFWMGSLIWVGGAIGLSLAIVDRVRRSGADFRDIFLVLAFLFGTGLSIAASGAAASHYLIQLVPFFAIGSGIVFSKLLAGRRRLLVSGAMVALMVLAFRPMAEAQYRLVGDIVEGRKMSRGVSYDISEYIANENACGQRTYFLTDHIGYWFNGSAPPSKIVTHPSNITKTDLLQVLLGPEATPQSEMERILATKPALIVTIPQLRYLRDSRAGDVLNATLKQDYLLDHEIEGRKIYRLLEVDGCGASAL